MVDRNAVTENKARVSTMELQNNKKQRQHGAPNKANAKLAEELLSGKYLGSPP